MEAASESIWSGVRGFDDDGVFWLLESIVEREDQVCPV